MGSMLVTSNPHMVVCTHEHIHVPRSTTSLPTYDWAAEFPFFLIRMLLATLKYSDIRIDTHVLVNNVNLCN